MGEKRGAGRSAPGILLAMPGGFELDHVFLCVPNLEGGVRLLTDRGLQCGIRSVHAGQGTADAVFFFDNAYLELLYARDEGELALPAARKLGLDQRLHWRKSGACPFGVAFRRRGPAHDDEPETWDYAAPFLAGGATIPIMTPAGLAGEPLLFIATVSAPPASYAEERGIPLRQGGRRRVLHRVRIDVPKAQLSANARQMASTALLGIQTATAEYHMELQFDSEPKTTVDFRPELPLSFSWAASR
jgi:Glyoxalase-like domain